MDRFDEIMSDYPDMTLNFERMPDGLKGIAIDSQITINSEISQQEQLQWLYEELGHVETSSGDISDYSSLENMKQERQARNWGIKNLLPLETIKQYKTKSVDNDFEVADELGVQVSYLHEAGYLYHILN